MLQIGHNYKSGEVSLKEVPDTRVKSGCLFVKNAFSVVSIGTEMMKVRGGKMGWAGKAKERPDQVKQVIQHMKKAGVVNTYKRVVNRLDRMTGLGYSSAGIVMEVGNGVTGFKVGDQVACAGSGHAEYVTVPKNLCALLPENVSLETAAFTTLGAIAMHGVRQSEAKLGESVAVIGLGLVGQIVAKILLAAGCKVVGIDLDDAKLKLAEAGGVDLVIRRDEEGLISRIQDFSTGLGVDAVIVAAGTQSNDPIELTPKIIVDRGKLVVLGISKMDIPWRTFYEKEIEVRLSRSYGPGRYDPVYEENGVDYPVGYVRWTQQRNMAAFLELQSRKKIDLSNIITHKFPFDEAEKVYESLHKNEIKGALGVLFEYRDNHSPARNGPPKIKTSRKSSSKNINVALIGAGNYTRNTILPLITKMDFLNLRSIVTSRGITAVDAQEKYGFEKSHTDAKEVLEDPQINTVIIATRHDSHAKLAAEALRHHKNVFLEKPLALSLEEFEEVEKCYHESEGILMVGFNRRFAPFVQDIKNFFSERRSPLAINYRVNAGMIPNDHWYQDPVKGGGRIIGEGCHFVDVIHYISGEKPVRVFSESFSTENQQLKNDDTANILIKLSNGSIATINYFSCGDMSYPKERLEVLGENSIAILDDFSALEMRRDGKKKLIKSRTKNKGHANELKAFFDAVQGKHQAPISFEEMKNATLVTFAATESFKQGMAISI